mmetsp:Transcript_29794/g.64932  ORF Transcript_29794/g.64932 Transcript_29794/m.64932 type:complete len:147 (+) Transcript_29794:93-533(+)|eukprot:CAMPEP_0170610280 /NCGR_PEP_ID=MMETSP0224-20130122/22571_1 /TAXON_ID=285029 /ORGANISM="Togula jolla, Strain CCCM 725" /LENGTH=146 /DNA_ID=CAMNT_0010935637 /DNA_START=89 /DNA_END=529 /DNA_ORIENTATION=-
MALHAIMARRSCGGTLLLVAFFCVEAASVATGTEATHDHGVVRRVEALSPWNMKEEKANLSEGETGSLEVNKLHSGLLQQNFSVSLASHHIAVKPGQVAFLNRGEIAVNMETGGTHAKLLMVGSFLMFLVFFGIGCGSDDKAIEHL